MDDDKKTPVLEEKQPEVKPAEATPEKSDSSLLKDLVDLLGGNKKEKQPSVEELAEKLASEKLEEYKQEVISKAVQKAKKEKETNLIQKEAELEVEKAEMAKGEREKQIKEVVEEQYVDFIAYKMDNENQTLEQILEENPQYKKLVKPVNTNTGGVNPNNIKKLTEQERFLLSKI